MEGLVLKKEWKDAAGATKIGALFLIIIPFMSLNQIQANQKIFYISIAYGCVGVLLFFLSKRIEMGNEKILRVVSYIWVIMILDSLTSLLITRNLYILLILVARIIILVYLLTPNKKVQEEVAKLKAKKGIE